MGPGCYRWQTLENLSSVLEKQGDLAAALDYGQRAFTSAEKKYKDKESGIVAAALIQVGNILREQGNFSAAAEHYHRALDMYEKLTPGSLNVADSLGNLAELERARKNPSLAMEYDPAKQKLAVFSGFVPTNAALLTKTLPYWITEAWPVSVGEVAVKKSDL